MWTRLCPRGEAIKRKSYLPGYWMLEPVNDIAVISKTDMPDADVAAYAAVGTARLGSGPGRRAQRPTPQSACAAVVDYHGGFSVNRREEAGEKLITANDIRAAHARGEQAMSVVLRAGIITPEAREGGGTAGLHDYRMRRVRHPTSAQACKTAPAHSGSIIAHPGRAVY